MMRARLLVLVVACLCCCLDLFANASSQVVSKDAETFEVRKFLVEVNIPDSVVKVSVPLVLISKRITPIKITGSRSTGITYQPDLPWAIYLANFQTGGLRAHHVHLRSEREHFARFLPLAVGRSTSVTGNPLTQVTFNRQMFFTYRTSEGKIMQGKCYVLENNPIGKIAAYRPYDLFGNMFGAAGGIKLDNYFITPASQIPNERVHSYGSKFHVYQYEYPEEVTPIEGVNDNDLKSYKQLFTDADKDFYYGTGLPVFKYQILQESNPKLQTYEQVGKNYILQYVEGDGHQGSQQLRTKNSPALGLGIDFTKGYNKNREPCTPMTPTEWKPGDIDVAPLTCVLNIQDDVRTSHPAEAPDQDRSSIKIVPKYLGLNTSGVFTETFELQQVEPKKLGQKPILKKIITSLVSDARTIAGYHDLNVPYKPVVFPANFKIGKKNNGGSLEEELVALEEHINGLLEE